MRLRSAVLATVAACLALATQSITGQSTAQPGRRLTTTPARRPPIQANTLDAAEAQFVRQFTNEFTQTLAVVAANPEAAFPAGTLAAGVRAGYLRLDPARRAAVRPDTLKLYPMTGAARPTGIVRVEPQAVVAIRTQPSGMSPALKATFRTLVRRRLDKLGPNLPAMIRSNGAGAIRTPRTWIEGGIFGEVNAGGKQEMTLNAPEELGFRWRSEEPGAVAGYWELRSRGTGLVESRVLATGVVQDNPNQRGTQGFFEINFAKYLPPKPPAKAEWTYYVRIKPLAVQRPQAQTAGPGARGPLSKTPTGSGPTVTNAGPPREPAGVGPWSTPVVIHYGASTNPPQKFSEVYRQVQFHFDNMYLEQDQQGPGAEEFHVAGFVQYNSSTGTGNQRFFGGFAKLDPDGPRLHAFNQRANFDLPPGATFPTSYTVVISILEEDDGGMLQDWMEAFWNVARGALADEFEQAVKEKLKDLGEKLEQETNEQAIETLAAAGSDDFLKEWIKLIVIMIKNFITGGLPDDFYGTEVVTFVLPSNDVDAVQQGAMIIEHGNTDEVLTGQPQGNDFRIRPKVLRFYGLQSYPEASAFNGLVTARMHFVLARRGL